MKLLLLVVSASLLFFSVMGYAHKGEVHDGADSDEKTSEVVEVKDITYPSIVKLHPPVVHFAIATPLLALLVSGYYHLRRKNPDMLEFAFIFIASSSVVAAAVSGYIAHESMEDLPIKREALELLHTHESVGIYLALLFSVIFLLRALYVLKPLRGLKILYITLLLIGVLGIFYQGNMGGSIVYDYGIGTNR